MNTLPRAITAQFFSDPTSYLALRQHWSSLMNSACKRDLSAAHHLLYLALLGKDWRAGFTPITNERKLANGAFHGWALFRALWTLHNPREQEWLLGPFEGHVSPAMLQLIRRIVPRPNSYAYSPAMFALGAFPFEAYNAAEQLLAPAAEDRVHA